MTSPWLKSPCFEMSHSSIACPCISLPFVHAYSRTTAHTLRQSPLQTRLSLSLRADTNMAPTPLVISWGIGPFVGIVVGGAVGLVLIVVLPILLVQRRRNARARKLDGHGNQELNTIHMISSKHQSIPRISIIPAEAATAAYDTLPSKENLRSEYQQDEKRKRKSDLLSWPPVSYTHLTLPTKRIV